MNEVIKADLNKDTATSAVTGFVSLLIVLLKLTNKIKIIIEVTKGIKGIRVVEFMKFPTKWYVSYLDFILFRSVILLKKIFKNLKCN